MLATRGFAVQGAIWVPSEDASKSLNAYPGPTIHKGARY
jgi:hypothetical protein